MKQGTYNKWALDFIYICVQELFFVRNYLVDSDTYQEERIINVFSFVE